MDIPLQLLHDLCRPFSHVITGEHGEMELLSVYCGNGERAKQFLLGSKVLPYLLGCETIVPVVCEDNHGGTFHRV